MNGGSFDECAFEPNFDFVIDGSDQSAYYGRDWYSLVTMLRIN